MNNKIRQNRYKEDPGSNRPALPKTHGKSLIGFTIVPILICLLSIIAIYAHDFVVQSPFFYIKKVTISGEKRVSKQDILELANLTEPANIFKVNISNMEKLIASHPWIASVSIKRSFLSTLVVSLVEEEPLAIVNIENLTDILINTQGKPFKEYEPEKDRVGSLPVISGVDLTRAGNTYQFEGQLFNSIINFLNTPNDLVIAVHGDENTGLTIQTKDIYNKTGLNPENSMQIKLGFDQFKEKMIKAKTISRYIDKNFPQKTICAMDLFNMEKVFIKTMDTDALHNNIEKGFDLQGNERIIVGLDIGTTKICAVAGEMLDDVVNIIGVGSHPSTGLRKGSVVNIESTVDSIKKAVEEAELMAGCDISSVYVGIAGNHVKGFNSHGIIAIKGREITQSDVERVIDAAKAVAIPTDREILHVIPQEFIVDDMEAIQNPVGMTAIRLEAKIHIVTGAVSSARNIVKCCNKAGLEVCDIVLESLASAHAVLTDEEKELGCVLADMGGGTTDLVLFKDNNAKFIYELTVGGHNLTNDISIGLRTPLPEAEKIKIDHGTCLAQQGKNSSTIEVPAVGGRAPKKLSKGILAEILEPRIEEIFTLLKKELFSNGLENSFPAGFVLTGGSVVLNGITEIAESVFNVPVRIGEPDKIGGLKDIVKNPAYATGVGLVIFGSKATCKMDFKVTKKQGFGNILTKIKQWFKDII